jgi:hypothetical protein
MHQLAVMSPLQRPQRYCASLTSSPRPREIPRIESPSCLETTRTDTQLRRPENQAPRIPRIAIGTRLRSPPGSNREPSLIHRTNHLQHSVCQIRGIMASPLGKSSSSDLGPPPSHPQPRRASPESSITLRHHRLAREASLCPNVSQPSPWAEDAVAPPRQTTSGESNDTCDISPANWFDNENRNTRYDPQAMDGASSSRPRC